MRTTRKPRAPIKGAARHYVLVPADAEDAFAFAKAAQERKGYTVAETGYRIRDAKGPEVIVLAS